MVRYPKHRPMSNLSDHDDLRKEFYALRHDLPLQPPECHCEWADRYENVWATGQTRVNLNRQSNETTKHTYINANKIEPLLTGCKTRYVATQAPLPETMADFFAMIVQNKITLVVMLTREVEYDRHGNTRRRADRYWPDTIEKMQHFGAYQVKLVEQNSTNTMCVRQLLVTMKDTNMNHHVQQIQYMEWPDHGVPKNYESVRQLFQEHWRAIQRMKVMETEPQVVVHCSAGIGRTGAFIAIDMILESVAAGKSYIGSVQLKEIVNRLRESRARSVQTDEQYVFIDAFAKWCIRNQILPHYNRDNVTDNGD